MKIAEKHLRKIIRNQLREASRDPTARHQSELSYAGHPGHSGRTKKPLQKRYWSQHRGPDARREIQSQLSSMGEIDIDTIGDLVPIGKERWNSLSGIPGPEGVSSEKDNYLINLAWDVVDGQVTMPDENLSKLIDLSPTFELQLTYAYDEQRTQEDIEDAFS
jgi:hypothetical protein